MGILNIPIFANGYIFKIYPKKKQWSCPQQNQNPTGDMDFSKMVSKVTVSGSSLEPKFDIFILFICLDF